MLERYTVAYHVHAMVTKRSASTAASTSQDSAKKAKRQVSVLTYKKWQTNYEQEYQMLSWLRCDVNERDKSLVGLLWCAVCRRFEERIRGVKNFSNVWITGSSNHKCSNVLDHARSDQHKAAMTRLRVEQSRAPASTYAPIAWSLLTMDKTVQEKMKKKFDICFVEDSDNDCFDDTACMYYLSVLKIFFSHVNNIYNSKWEY